MLPQHYPNAIGKFQPIFSGHETFALRGNWLKKAYDLLCVMPDLFSREDAFVRLGVGKNMAQSIRHWGRVCAVFDRVDEGYAPTPLGHALLGDQAWDPFLVTPAARWLLHWQISSRPEAAFTWFYTFNILRHGEFSAVQLAEQLSTYTIDHGFPAPSAATLRRDIDCMLHCYVRPAAKQIAAAAEDALACPLADLDLIQLLSATGSYRLASGLQPDLPDAMVAFAVRSLLRRMQRVTISFGELAFSIGSPGRVFRLDEDALLERIERIEKITDGRASYSDTAGVRQVRWSSALDLAQDDFTLLRLAFNHEVRFG
jgi:Protein of unknown function (DUF4007)